MPPLTDGLEILLVLEEAVLLDKVSFSALNSPKTEIYKMSVKLIYSGAHTSDQRIGAQTGLMDVLIMIYCISKGFPLCDKIPIVPIYSPCMSCASAIVSFIFLNENFLFYIQKLF